MTTSIQEQSLHKMPQFVPCGMQTNDDGHFECYITSNIYFFKNIKFCQKWICQSKVSWNKDFGYVDGLLMRSNLYKKT